MLNEALWSFGMAVLAQNYSVRGLTVIAAMNIANTINNLFSVVFAAMGESVAIIVGQALGFGDMKRAREIDNKMIVSCVLISFAVSVFMFLFAPFFPGFIIRRKLCERRLWDLFWHRRCLFPRMHFSTPLILPFGQAGKQVSLFSLTVYSYGASTFRSFLFYADIPDLPVGGLQCDADRGMAEVYCGRGNGEKGSVA